MRRTSLFFMHPLFEQEPSLQESRNEAISHFWTRGHSRSERKRIVEKILLVIGYLCVVGTVKSLGFVPRSFSYFDLWILALNFLIAVYLLRFALKSVRWLPSRLFVVNWLIRKNQKLKCQVAALESEVEELNSEITTLVECWAPRINGSRLSVTSNTVDLQQNQSKSFLQPNHFGLSMDFAESSGHGEASIRPVQKSESQSNQASI